MTRITLDAPLQTSARWAVTVRWPDGRCEQLEVCEPTMELAERYAQDIWGASVTATATALPAHQRAAVRAASEEA